MCFLRSFCLGQTRFWGTFGSFVRGDWWDGHMPVFGGGLGAAMASLRARLGSTVALPRHSGMLLAAPHSSWHPHDHPGPLQGPWDGPQMDLGPESHRGQPRATRSRCLSRPWELFGAKPLHNPRAVVSPPVTGCSRAQQGAGSDLKKENFPIHTQPDARDVWHSTRKATGTLGEVTSCPR